MLRNCNTCSNLCLRTSKRIWIDDDGCREILHRSVGCKKGSVPHLGTSMSNDCKDWEEIH